MSSQFQFCIIDCIHQDLRHFHRRRLRLLLRLNHHNQGHISLGYVSKYTQIQLSTKKSNRLRLQGFSHHTLQEVKLYSRPHSMVNKQKGMSLHIYIQVLQRRLNCIRFHLLCPRHHILLVFSDHLRKILQGLKSRHQEKSGCPLNKYSRYH